MRTAASRVVAFSRAVILASSIADLPCGTYAGAPDPRAVRTTARSSGDRRRGSVRDLAPRAAGVAQEEGRSGAGRGTNVSHV
ncbi:hypothetical protein GCM10017562_46340 [Streptomyces roseofulvus]